MKTPLLLGLLGLFVSLVLLSRAGHSEWVDLPPQESFQGDLVDTPDAPSSSSSLSYASATLPALTSDTPPANFQALVDTQVKNFPTYHADYSAVDTSSTWMRDPNGNVVNMPFAGKSTAFTYYTPGTLVYPPQTYVPTYTESVFLSATNNTAPPAQKYRGFDLQTTRGLNFERFVIEESK